MLDDTTDITNVIDKQTPNLPLIDGFGCVYNVKCIFCIQGSQYHFDDNVIYNTTDKAFVKKSFTKSFDSDVSIKNLSIDKVQRVKYGYQDA